RKRALRPGSKRPREPKFRASALRELEAASRLGAAVLLALDHPTVASQKAALLQERPQGRLVEGERFADAVPEGGRLAREAAALNRAVHVILAHPVHDAEGLIDQHAQHRPREIDRAISAVDRDLAGPGLEPDPRDRVLALAGRVGAALGVELRLRRLRRGLRL